MSEVNENPNTPRVIPDGWVPLSAAIAWVAHGTAVRNWGEHFYLGAEFWPGTTPSELAAELREFLAVKAPAQRSYPLAIHLAESRAQQLSLVGWDERLWEVLDVGTADERSQLVRRFLEDLVHRLDGADETYESFWRASEALRRAIVNGDLVAFGFEGDLPDPASVNDLERIGKPRQRIPSDVFSAPVMLDRGGVRPRTRGDQDIGGYDYLWSALLFDGENLLKSFAENPSDGPTQLYGDRLESQAVAPKGRRGRPDGYDWLPFYQELAAQIINLIKEEERKRLIAHMIFWSKRNMEGTPDQSRIRARIRDLIKRNISTP